MQSPSFEVPLADIGDIAALLLLVAREDLPVPTASWSAGPPDGSALVLVALTPERVRVLENAIAIATGAEDPISKALRVRIAELEHENATLRGERSAVGGES
jgi:hypothetical protein